MAYWDSYGEFDGLQRIDLIELNNEAYQFYLLGLWKAEGREEYYLATDSGCSCPTPWENTLRADLTGPLTREQAREEATSLIDAARPKPVSEGGYEWHSEGPNQQDVELFMTNFN